MKAPLVVFASAVAVLLAGGCRRKPAMDEIVPQSMAGWNAPSPGASYDRETLYDYIDGAADVYLAYDFRRAFARRFVKEDEPAITVDVFDMGRPEDAYGIFSFEREGGDAGIGQGSEYAAGMLRFWTGRLFVSILAERETTASKEAVLALGKAIAASIKPDGAPPKLVALLPPDGLDQHRLRYFHRHESLNYHFFVAEKNILRLGPTTEAALGRYKDGSRLLVVRYPSEREAAAAMQSFVDAYMPDAHEGVVRTEDGLWTAARMRGTLLTIVFNAPQEQRVPSFIEAVEQQEGEK